MSEARLSSSELLLLNNLWASYFPKDPFMASDGRVSVIALFKKFFVSQLADGGMLKSSSLERGLVELSYPELCSRAPVGDFGGCLQQQPKETLGCLALALGLVASAVGNRKSSLPKLECRILHMEPLLAYGNLKANMIGKLVSMRGNVVRVGPVRPLVTSACFNCSKCGVSFRHEFDDGRFTIPSKCPTIRCRAKYFQIRRETAITLDYQRIKLQEMDADDADPGRMPRTVEVEMRDSLVGTCVPGDVVNVVGLVKSAATDMSNGSRGNQPERSSALHVLYVEANSIETLRSSRTSRQGPGLGLGLGSDAATYTTHDLKVVREIASVGCAFELLVASLCPSIFGHELVKAGLLLGLVGGSACVGVGGVRRRSDIHVLMVGDPGLGKSQMLRACAAVSPVSVMVTGNTTSTTGLTVTLTREAGSGDMGLEAGALVLADQGVCIIDEFDKMSFDSHALLEAMEQQQVSVAKSGVVTSLSSRCSVIAAANPVGGHYNRRKSVCENLKMNAALLSRFDLVFILVDRPDQDHDRRVSQHIMRIHQASTGVSKSNERAFAQEHRAADAETEEGTGSTITQRLRKVATNFTSQTVPAPMLRKYLAYAREYCRPRLTAPAAKILQKLYLTMRSESSLGRSIPVTTRHLMSLIRLAQARAKVELRTEVTAQDAEDVVKMLQESLLDAFTTENGEIDFGRKGGLSLSKQVKAMVAALNRESEIRGSASFQLKEIEQIIYTLGMPVTDTDTLLEVMRSECYLLKKGPRLYQLQTSTVAHTQQG